MMTEGVHFFILENREELLRARYKIKCLLSDKKDANALIERLHNDYIVAKHEKEECAAANGNLKKQNNKLQRKLNTKKRKITQLREDVARAEECCITLEKALKAVKAEYHTWYLEQQASEDETGLLSLQKVELELELADARELNRHQDDQIAALKLKNAQLKEEVQAVRSTSASKEQRMLTVEKELKKVRNGLQKQLKQALKKRKEHGEMMQRQQMEQRLNMLEKANKSKAKQKRRTEKRRASGTWDVQPRCDEETAHFEEKSKVAEDEVVVQLEPSQSSGASMNANVAISLADCDVESKENVYAGESSQNEEVNTILPMEPTLQDSEDIPSSSPESVPPPPQPTEMVVQAIRKPAVTSPFLATDWMAGFPHGAGHSVPRARKRRRSFIKLTIAAKRRSVLINQAINTVANYKQRPAILRITAPLLGELRVKKKKIIELQEQVDFLLELHEKVDEAFLEVSVDFQKMCEQFTPQHSDINQLVISKLPQNVTGREDEDWCTVFQALLGLSTTACSSRDYQSLFNYWLSGRGKGPPVWKTLIDALRHSGIMVLECIANCLQARLHEHLPHSRQEDDRCCACGRFHPRFIEEEDDVIFSAQEESTDIDSAADVECHVELVAKLPEK